ncbi:MULTISPECIES: aldehyde dehydrogenase family protein [unclassified Psychrobacillus]|uniref:aldehyde dehydrogenase family protein n=1 Tax=unclassified Psychrobacillus TaxID=2636677 RepID=UPI00146C834E|nr:MULTISPECIES: aldehyde dehydrogenase family protein [unclassified Psychrobacillus]MCM3356636.1 aldehyde dehydrogenase family protein [Psychrobacillus sp. MER TA 171]NME07819.1 aldehyde dehydrogenase family protein [Psychrobacillus sp. BL-248-WT-3]
MEKINMLINGEWVSGNQWIDVRDPATSDVIAQIVRGNETHVDEAVAAARLALKSKEWKAFKPFQRGQLLVELAGYIRLHAEELAALESLDVGKPMNQARADVEAAARYFEFYGGIADKVFGDTIPIEENLLNVTVVEPIGVTVHIVPWNYPIQITARSVGAALATGNVVIVKSSEDTPLSTNFLAQWFHEKLPKGVFQHLTGYGAEVGAALSSHKGINQITFTGSVQTGISVMQSAAANIVPVTLELGGKSPNIVFQDADLDRAIPAIVNSITQNAGQTCSAGSRLLVQDTIADELLEQLVVRFGELSIGPASINADVGPIINQKQHERILNILSEASKQGNVLVGGKGVEVRDYENGYYISPTIIEATSHEESYVQEEIFGPVLSVVRFHSVEEAIELANETEYGLVAGVWSKDIDVAHYVAARIEAGQVFINTYGAAGGVQMPFGGYKKSGIGREKSHLAVQNYIQIKNLAIQVKI